MESPPAMRTLFRAASATSRASTLGAGQLALARKRLLGASLVVGATMLAYYVAFKTVWEDAATAIGGIVAPVSVVLFGAIALFVWRAAPTRPRLIAAGVLFHVGLGAGLAAMEPFDIDVLDGPAMLISWNCVNVLLVPALVPASMPVAGAVAFGIAALTPLGFGIASATGAAPQSADVLVSLGAPPLVCAALSLLPSGVLRELRRDLSKARRLGAYELVERLGAGGMGEVWRANHRFLARPAAIKLIQSELLGGSDDARAKAIGRFEREAQAIATLESPHTVELYDFGVADDGDFYFVMELLRGVDLQRLVDAHGPLPPERVVHLMLQACDSLAEAHALGLVHRDIKPANLHVGPRGQADDVLRVLDFGLVTERLLEGAGDAGVTNDGTIRGTPATLAPEAATGEAPVDGRADLYALGCVAFFLLTGETVFEGRNAMDVVIAHVTKAPEAPSARAPGLPEDLDALVLECLVKDPAERMPSAETLAVRLRELEAVLPPWTPARARSWWDDHVPEARRRPSAPPA
ncbi:MAG: serine/threonine-protein kinase [Myxococcota bacterium]